VHIPIGIFLVGVEPLLCAAKHGHEEITRLLIESGASLNSTDEWDNTPLSLATELGPNEVVKILVEHGADINQVGDLGRTFLGEVISRDFDAALVRLLIERRANIEEEIRNTLTPLMLQDAVVVMRLS
jgi:ankyrin repeat protein